MSTIDSVNALEILDSRGTPTISVTVECQGNCGEFSVPSGASTGRHEAFERRDDETRYGGKGVRSAVRAVTEEIAPELIGQDVFEQAAIDEMLVELDGTQNLERLGANAVLGASGAVLRAASHVADEPLYRYLDGGQLTLPMPMINLLSGGLHAGGGIDVQDILVIPTGSQSFSEALETVWNVRHATQELIVDADGRPLVADEGGFSPALESVTGAFELACAAIDSAGYIPGDDVSLGVDIASSHFYDERANVYRPSSREKPLTPAKMIQWVLEWTEQFPLVSIEDPLAEDAWSHWTELMSSFDAEMQVIGDDLFVTSDGRVRRGIEGEAANAVLIKPNQTGTITRTRNVVETAADAGLNRIVSARSGETSDPTIADLAVGWDCGQIKIGSLARSERLAKYNRLLAIEDETAASLAPFPSCQ